MLGLVKSNVMAVAPLAVGSFALYVAAIVAHAKRDAVTELAIRGRVYGSNTTLQALPSLLIAGLLADRFGAAPVFLISGLVALAAIAIGPAFRDRALGSV